MPLHLHQCSQSSNLHKYQRHHHTIQTLKIDKKKSCMVYVGVPWEFNTLSVQLTTLRFPQYLAEMIPLQQSALCSSTELLFLFLYWFWNASFCHPGEHRNKPVWASSWHVLDLDPGQLADFDRICHSASVFPIIGIDTVGNSVMKRHTQHAIMLLRKDTEGRVQMKCIYSVLDWTWKCCQNQRFSHGD